MSTWGFDFFDLADGAMVRLTIIWYEIHGRPAIMAEPCPASGLALEGGWIGLKQGFGFRRLVRSSPDLCLALVGCAW